MIKRPVDSKKYRKRQRNLPTLDRESLIPDIYDHERTAFLIQTLGYYVRDKMRSSIVVRFGIFVFSPIQKNVILQKFAYDRYMRYLKERMSKNNNSVQRGKRKLFSRYTRLYSTIKSRLLTLDVIIQMLKKASKWNLSTEAWYESRRDKLERDAINSTQYGWRAFSIHKRAIFKTKKYGTESD